MRSVLVVDDRITNREYFASLLNSKGFRVYQATDGATALQIVRAEKPSLVLADILMPRMDGYEFVRRVREDPEIASTPVVFISGQFPPEEATALAERCGVSEVLFKPVEPEKILAAVHRALAKGPPPIAPAQVSDPAAEFDELHRELLTDTLARKSDELEHTNRRLAALVTLGRQLAAEQDVKRLLQLFCSAAGDIVSAKYIIVALRDLKGDELRHIVASGGEDETLGAITTTHAIESLLRFAPGGRSLLIGNHDTRIDSIAAAFRALVPLLVAPVATATRRYGVLCLGQVTGANRPNGPEQEFATTLAAQLAVTYENAARYAEAQRHAEELQREVNERKRAQGETRKLNQELEARVLERTRALEQSHQQLRLSERMASMGTLCAGLGHDMGNLLLPIRTHVDAIVRLQPDESMKEHIAAIRQCVDYLQSLTNGLRMLWRDPRQTKEDAVTDLGPWSEEIKPLLTSLLAGGMKLECKLPHDLPVVHISRAGLSQAVFNVVSNAVDALRNRENGTVRIEASRSSNGKFVNLCVTDDGPGMEEQVRSRVLDPFFTTKKRALSTGLGLSLVHGIVKSAGGKIEIDSAPGRGTKVTLVLPVARRAADGSDEVIADGRPVAAVSVRDLRLRGVVATLLNSMGYEAQMSAPHDGEDPPLWLIEAGSTRLEDARDFLRRHPDGRIAVLGDMNPEWRALGAIHLGDKKKPEEIRARLRELTTPPAVPAGAS